MFAFFTCITHVKKQLREHQPRRRGGFFRLEPDFLSLNVDQTFVVLLQAKRLDVGVFYIFFSFNF